MSVNDSSDAFYGRDIRDSGFPFGQDVSDLWESAENLAAIRL